MMLSLHPEAVKRAEELAIRAFDGMTSEPSVPSDRETSYMPVVPISGHITAADLVGPILQSQADRFGREIERSYTEGTHHFALRGSAHEDFVSAAKVLWQQRDVSAIATQETVARLVFDWMCKARINGPGQRLSDYLSACLEPLIGDIEVIIPIFGLHVQSLVHIGQVTIADISAKELSDWREVPPNATPEQEAFIDTIDADLRKRLLGRAAARMKVHAETNLAVQRATEQAELAVSILRLASIGAFAPEKPTVFALMGQEIVTHGVHVTLGPQHQCRPSEFIVHAEDQRPWILDDEFIERMAWPLMKPWSLLVGKEKRTSLEEAALRSVLLYSKATRYRNISEKLLHIFAATESLLLRAESEPISAAVSDRLAFAVGQTSDERMRIAANFREVYAMRSKFVHHALEPSPDTSTLRSLEAFLQTISSFFCKRGLEPAEI
jgi:hypothetical protein